MLYRPASRVDGRGDIFFRSLPVRRASLSRCLARVPISRWRASLFARACLGSIPLTAWVVSSFRSGGSDVFFSFARPPIAGSSLLARLVCSPAPGAWDVRTGDRFAAAGGTAVCLLLIVSCRSLRLRSFAFVLPAVWVFISCLVFLPACLVGSRSPVAEARSALRPALLVEWRGGLLCRGFLSSRVARCLEFRSSWSLVHRRLVVSPRARPSSSLLASPPRLVRWRREYLVPAYCLSPIRKSPRPSYRRGGAIFPVSVVLAYSSMMA